MIKKREKIVIGQSDYTREEMRNGNIGWTFGTSSSTFLDIIAHYEHDGYEVKFETNLIQRIFGLGKYKVTAYKEQDER